MKLAKYIFYSLVVILLSNCAKTGRPDGGPKDEKAPLFVTSNPPYKSTFFKSKKVRLEFNEFIKLKDINKQLVVSPPLKNPLLITPQGTATKFLDLKILDTLKENTTYIFNFGNAVEDNNESNVLEGFNYIFSTGDYIDSLNVKGEIGYSFLNTKPKRISLLLYKVDSTYTDSTLFKRKPNYVTTALDTLKFVFSNLKDGKYQVIALEESVSDYTFNPASEKIGFYNNIISLPKDSLITTPIKVFKEELNYKFKKAKEASKGKIEFSYVGKPKDLKVTLLSKVADTFKSISMLEKGKDTLNFWHTPTAADSLNFIIATAKIADTVTVKLRKNKIDSLTIKPTVTSILHFRDTFFIQTNNPIITIDTSKISLVNKDTVPINYKKISSKLHNKIAFIFDKKEQQTYTISLLPGSLTDIYKTQNDTLKYRFSTKLIEDYGRITLNVDKQVPHNVIIDLLAGKNNEIIERRIVTQNTTKLVFDKLLPQTYSVRAIIDVNKNNKWDTGNFLQKKQPETVIYAKETYKVRANYYLDGNNFTIKN